uniref:Uncharacterized protein n=1 Tax=Cacopsylla melanoneura TaxID=428564 RepID=A0A8D8RYT0_9HEMI
MVRTQFLVCTLFFAVVWSQSLQPSTTPVPILKQINRQNEDGSYSYGYENADGSFKIETKYKNGEVYGKYGYVGADGKLREVEYGATKLGFQPAGSDIDVPPPTIVNENALQNADYDDGQYREDPSIYYKTDKFNSVPAKSAPAPVKSAAPAAPAPAPAPSRQTWSAPQQQTRSWSAPQTASWNVAPQQNWNFAPAQQQVPSWQAPQQSQWEAPQPVQWSPPQQRSWVQPQQSWQAPVQQSWTPPQQGSDSNLALFVGHPAKNFDLATGSYSISYNG